MFSYISKELGIKYTQVFEIITYLQNFESTELHKLIEEAMKQISSYEGDIRQFKFLIKKENQEFLTIGNIIHSSLIKTISKLKSKNIKIIFGHHHMLFKSTKKLSLGKKNIIIISPGAGGAESKRSSGYIIFYTNGNTELIEF